MRRWSSLECIHPDELTHSQIKRPSLAYEDGRPLYFVAPPQLYEQTKGNLEKLVSDLVQDGEDLTVTDPGLPFSLSVTVRYV